MERQIVNNNGPRYGSGLSREGSLASSFQSVPVGRTLSDIHISPSSSFSASSVNTVPVATLESNRDLSFSKKYTCFSTESATTLFAKGHPWNTEFKKVLEDDTVQWCTAAVDEQLYLCKVLNYTDKNLTEKNIVIFADFESSIDDVIYGTVKPFKFEPSLGIDRLRQMIGVNINYLLNSGQIVEVPNEYEFRNIQEIIVKNSREEEIIRHKGIQRIIENYNDYVIASLSVDDDIISSSEGLLVPPPLTGLQQLEGRQLLTRSVSERTRDGVGLLVNFQRESGSPSNYGPGQLNFNHKTYGWYSSGLTIFSSESRWNNKFKDILEDQSIDWKVATVESNQFFCKKTHIEDQYGVTKEVVVFADFEASIDTSILESVTDFQYNHETIRQLKGMIGEQEQVKFRFNTSNELSSKLVKQNIHNLLEIIRFNNQDEEIGRHKGLTTFLQSFFPSSSAASASSTTIAATASAGTIHKRDESEAKEPVGGRTTSSRKKPRYDYVTEIVNWNQLDVSLLRDASAKDVNFEYDPKDNILSINGQIIEQSCKKSPSKFKPFDIKSTQRLGQFKLFKHAPNDYSLEFTSHSIRIGKIGDRLCVLEL